MTGRERSRLFGISFSLFLAAALACVALGMQGDALSDGALLIGGLGVGVLAASAISVLTIASIDHTASKVPADTAHDGEDASSSPGVALAAARTGAEKATPSAKPAEKPLTSTFDADAFSVDMLTTDDPIGTLKLVVGDIRTREAHAKEGLDHDASGKPELPPGGLERYLARSLEEAGLFSVDVDLPHINVVRPRRSGLFFFRIEEGEVAYLAKLRVIELESALNRTLFATLLFPDPDSATEEDVVRINQNLEASIASQAIEVTKRLHTEDGSSPSGEYALREGLATGIETFQLPYRLSTTFRSNVSDGAVAIEIALTPPEVFSKSIFSEDLGRIVPTTATMRRQACSSYALRIGLLVAAQAFACAPNVDHVFVASVLDTATRHACYYSVDFDRARFEGIDFSFVRDPIGIYQRFGATIDPDGDGILDPVIQSFNLEDERFCPVRRYEQVGLSNRELDAASAKALGTSQVAGLAINEEARREQIASDIGRYLGDSTEKNVHVILDLAGADPDPSVRQAARRTVSKLIDGTLSEQNPLEVEDEFVAGDELSRAVDKSMELLAGKARDSAKAAKLLTAILDPMEAAGTYADDDSTCYRYFSSYVERALFNRMYPTANKRLVLVPDAYYEAQLILSSAYLDLNAAEKAAAHANRAKELDPLDERARLRLVRCYEYRDAYSLAIDELRGLLEIAHDPESVGIAYYRMAFMQWKSGNLTVAQACYRKCQQFMSSCYALSMIELQTLLRTDAAGAILADDRIDATLSEGGIPLAPTEQIGQALVECTRASLDSEVFPVARNFATILGALTGDDVVFDIIRSIELEPDR